MRQTPESASSTDDVEPPVPARRSWVLPAIVGSALLLQTLSATVILNALPAIAAAFSVAPVRLNTAITFYMLAAAVFLPFSGWLADRYGARRVFLGAIFVYGLASCACGLAQSVEQLIWGRVAQGAAGAALLPVGRLILLRTIPRSQLVNALAILTIPALLGPVIGPILGGAIVTFSDWPWIFFINLPLAAVGLMLGWRFVPDVKSRHAHPVDFVGAVLTGGGLSAIILAFEALGADQVSVSLVLGRLAAGAAALALYVWHARRIANPIIDLSIFRSQSYSASTVGGGLFRVSNAANPFLLVMLLQVNLGHSPVAAGMMIAISGAGALLMKMAAPPLLRRFGFRTVLIVNGVLVSIFFAAGALFTAAWPVLAIMAVLGLVGFFRSLQFTALGSLAFAEVGEDQLSAASTTASVAQQLAQSLGVALAAALLHLMAWGRGDAAADSLAVGPAFIFFGLVAAASVLWFLPLARTVGDDMNGRTPAP